MNREVIKATKKVKRINDVSESILGNEYIQGAVPTYETF